MGRRKVRHSVLDFIEDPRPKHIRNWDPNLDPVERERIRIEAGHPCSCGPYAPCAYHEAMEREAPEVKP